MSRRLQPKELKPEFGSISLLFHSRTKGCTATRQFWRGIMRTWTMSHLALISAITDNSHMPLSARNRIWLLTVCSLGLCGMLRASPPPDASEIQPVSDDYLVRTWDTEDNLSGSTVTAILQTPDG